MANFPNSLDNLTDVASTEPLGTAGGGVGLAAVINELNDAVEKIEAKVGVDNSAVTTSLDYILKNTSGGHRHSGVAGDGRKIRAVDLDTSTLTANQLLRVNSAGSAVESSGKLVPVGDIVGTTDTQTLTNKTLISSTNVLEEVTTVSSGATITPTGGSLRNALYITALAENTTINAPSGTPSNGNRLIIRIKDNGTARNITWNAIYRAVGTNLPISTTANKTIYCGFIYNSADTKWDCIAVSKEI